MCCCVSKARCPLYLYFIAQSEIIFKSKTLMYSEVLKITPIICHLGSLQLRSGCMFLKNEINGKITKITWKL